MARTPLPQTRLPWAICRSLLLSDHPSWNSARCRAVRDVLRYDGAGPGPGSPAKFDGSDQHRIHPNKSAVADLGSVLASAVEVGRDRASTDVRVGAEIRVTQVGDVRHPAVPAHLRPHE